MFNILIWQKMFPKIENNFFAKTSFSGITSFFWRGGGLLRKK